MIFNVSKVSSWNNTGSQQEYYIWLPGIGITVVYAIIITIGLLGNVTLMKICICVKSMRTVPNLLMSSLALGDLLLLVTCAPVDASRYLVDEWLFGRVGCKLIPFIQLTSVGVSVFTLTALSFDRYKAVVKSMDVQRSRITVSIRFQATAIWLLSMTLAIPEAIFSDLHTFHISETNETFVTCAPYPHEVEMHPKIHSMAFFMVFYLLPLLVISVCYCFIARTLMRSTVEIPVARHLHGSRQFDSRKRLSKTVLVFVGLFSICWLPTHVIYLHRSYHYGQVDTSMAHFVSSVCARILAFTNSCLNPFALYLMSKSFHTHFNRQLMCSCHTSKLASQSAGNTQITSV